MNRLAVIRSLLLPAVLAPIAANAELATVAAQRATAVARYEADAVIEASRHSVLAAQVPGRVVLRAVEAGDSVVQGQLLVSIDDSDAAQAESAARAQVAAARAQLANAATELERTRALHAKEFVSKAALDRAETAYRSARAQFDALSASAGVSSTERGFKRISAPYDGVVAETHVTVGDLAVPGKPLLTIYDPTRMRVVASLPQARLAAWRRELPVRVRLPLADGTLTEVAATRITPLPLTDPGSQIVQVRLDLPGDLGAPRPGTLAKALFPIDGGPRLTVPSSAVIRRGELTAVYVVGPEQRVRLRQVRLGPADGDTVEVAAGLLEGERVALDPFAAARARRQEPAP